MRWITPEKPENHPNLSKRNPVGRVTYSTGHVFVSFTIVNHEIVTCTCQNYAHHNRSKLCPTPIDHYHTEKQGWWWGSNFPLPHDHPGKQSMVVVVRGSET